MQQELFETAHLIFTEFALKYKIFIFISLKLKFVSNVFL